MISEDRLAHLASVMVDGVWNDDLIDFEDEDFAMRTAKNAAAAFGAELIDIDQKANAKLMSLKRGVPEGSPEWEVMYSKYFEEEMSRRGY